MKGKTKPRGKGKTKVTAAWVDSDTESESLKVASESDSPKLSKKEKEDLAHGYDPVKIHQRAVARKLKTKAHSCKSTSLYRLGASLTLSQAEKTSVALRFHHPDLRTVWGDLERKPAIEVKEKAAQSADLKVKLLPFQQESLFWMRKQEKYSEWKGGMLANEMGGFSLFTPYLELTTYQVWGRPSKHSRCS